jgi:hypothetical protein
MQRLHTLAVAFWLAILGGVLLLASWLFDSSVLWMVGAALFAAGVVWFFAWSIAAAHREGVGLAKTVARGIKDAARFAFELMP